jgi:uncharacterized protein YycO
MEKIFSNNIIVEGVELEVGDIVLYKGKGLFSRLVSFFTRSKYSHVAMMISDTLLIEANWYKKSNTVPFSYVPENMEIYRLKESLSTDQKLTLLEHCYGFLNKTYDYPQIFGYVLNFFNKNHINVFNSPKKLICSELIDRAYLKIGVDLSSEHFIGDVRPVDLANSDKLIRVL